MTSRYNCNADHNHPRHHYHHHNHHVTFFYPFLFIIPDNGSWWRMGQAATRSTTKQLLVGGPEIRPWPAPEEMASSLLGHRLVRSTPATTECHGRRRGRCHDTEEETITGHLEGKDIQPPSACWDGLMGETKRSFIIQQNCFNRPPTYSDCYYGWIYLILSVTELVTWFSY